MYSKLNYLLYYHFYYFITVKAKWICPSACVGRQGDRDSYQQFRKRKRSHGDCISSHGETGVNGFIVFYLFLSSCLPVRFYVWYVYWYILLFWFWWILLCINKFVVFCHFSYYPIIVLQMSRKSLLLTNHIIYIIFEKT